MQEIQTVKPWYKQFWPWMIMGLPASVVVASIVTYFIALDGIDSVISKIITKRVWQSMRI